jgi:hypothetical protein
MRRASAAALITLTACNGLFGVDDLRYDATGAGAGSAGGAVGAGGTSTSSSSTSGGGGQGGAQTTGSSTGAGGAGGAGGGPQDLGEPQWSVQLGAVGDVDLLGLAVDGAGDVVIALEVAGTIDAGGGDVTGPLVLVKLDADGNHLWSKGYTSTSNPAGNVLAATDQNHIFVVGAFEPTINLGGATLNTAGQHDIFAARLDASGGHVWSQRFGSTDFEFASGTAATPTGGLLLTGNYRDNLAFGGATLPAAAPSGDGFTAALDGNGSGVWARATPGANTETFFTVAATPSGGAVSAGRFLGDVSPGGSSVNAVDGWDAVVVQLDANGAYEWSQTIGGIGDEFARATVDSSGEVVVVGKFSDNVDFGNGATASAGGTDSFVVKRAPSGQLLWAFHVGSSGDDSIAHVAVDAERNILLPGRFDDDLTIAGSTPLSPVGGDDGFIAKLDPTGAVLWARTFGGALDDGISYAKADAAGNVFALGYFSGTIDVAGEMHSAVDLQDAFVVKLSK